MVAISHLEVYLYYIFGLLEPLIPVSLYFDHLSLHLAQNLLLKLLPLYYQLPELPVLFDYPHKLRFLYFVDYQPAYTLY